MPPIREKKAGTSTAAAIAPAARLARAKTPTVRQDRTPGPVRSSYRKNSAENRHRI